MSSQLLPGQRQRLILQRLRQDGAVETARLAHELGASTVTVRRDLDALIGRGLASRVHGGAVAAPANREEAAGQPRAADSPTPVLREVPTAHVVPLLRNGTSVDVAERHLRFAERLLAIAERQLRRDKREDAGEWRALAELHIRLAECVRGARAVGDTARYSARVAGHSKDLAL